MQEFTYFIRVESDINLENFRSIRSGTNLETFKWSIEGPRKRIVQFIAEDTVVHTVSVRSVVISAVDSSVISSVDFEYLIAFDG